MTKIRFRIMASFTASTLLFACSTAQEKDAQKGTRDIAMETIEVPIGLTEGEKLSLASASEFNMSLTGCASGHTLASITQTSTSISVYNGDIGCIVRLNSFKTSSGVLYQLVGRYMDSAFAAGARLSFASSTNPNEMAYVTVVSQLSSPLVSSDVVGYSFLITSEGEQKSVATGIDVGSLEVAGDEAPMFSLVSSEMTGISSDGYGLFEFTLECDLPVDGSNCATSSLSDLSYLLIAIEDKDTFKTLTLDQANAYFADQQTSVQSLEAFDLTTGNGGFTTPALRAPSQLSAKKDMVFIIKSKGSYRYYVIDVLHL